MGVSILLLYLLLIYELLDLTCRTDSAARLADLKEGVRPAPQGVLLVKAGKGKLGRAYLLVVLVEREGLDLGPGSMGPAIDHEGLDTGLERKSMLHIALLQFPLLTPGQFVDRPSYLF